jgi:hypothetical protein
MHDWQKYRARVPFQSSAAGSIGWPQSEQGGENVKRIRVINGTEEGAWAETDFRLDRP